MKHDYCIVERSEKDQNWKLQFPQADHLQGHSPDFKTVFGIMIGPFPLAKLAKREVHKMRKSPM